jgi:hypothetical protein
MSEEKNSDDELTILANSPDPGTRFNAACNKVFLHGTKNYADFEQTVERLKGAELTSKEFLEQVMESDDPSKLLHQLGSEEGIEQAKKLAKLSPFKRAKALAAIERGERYVETTPTWKKSKAELGDHLSSKEWSALWDKKHGHKWGVRR